MRKLVEAESFMSVLLGPFQGFLRLFQNRFDKIAVTKNTFVIMEVNIRLAEDAKLLPPTGASDQATSSQLRPFSL